MPQLTKQGFGGLLVVPALRQDIQNEPLLIGSAPELVLLACDGNDYLINVSLSPRRGVRRRMRLAYSRPNFRPHCRIGS